MIRNDLDAAPHTVAPTPPTAAIAPMLRLHRAKRWTHGGLALATVWLALGAAQAADLVPVAQVEQDYVRPHALVDVGDGRRMNLFCLGEGPTTVVFDSGLSDWSSTWALIQPAVARTTRACTYDRPGMGYSDPSPLPRTPEAAVQDLSTLLKRGGISGRVVLVGHSLGGFHAKLFAVTYPEQVAGLVLVDPAEERLWDRVESSLARRFGATPVRAARAEDERDIAAAITHFADCAQTTRAGGLTEQQYRRCTDPVRLPLGTAILQERRTLQQSVAYQEAQASEIAHCMYAQNPAADARYRRLFAGRTPLGDLPLIVLTHGLYDLSEPDWEVHYWSWRKAHELTATLSRRGRHEMVAHANHNMQVDRPDAIVDAVLKVVAMVEQPP